VPPDCPVSQRSNGHLHATVDSDSEQCRTVHAAEIRAEGQKGTGLSGVAPDCPVWHRTVRCGTGLSGVAPDCPLTYEDKASKGRPAPTLTKRMTWRRTGHCPVAQRTVRCAHRQQPSPTATIWLVAINTTPTVHFKVWEPKQHFKSSS
jgi:hypothetical protein